jgi:drug/metabolite transporter (DMT)-like permease
MTSVVGGLGAAVIWSVGATFSSRAAQMVGPILTLAWVMLIGLVAMAVLLPLSSQPHLSGTALGWLAVGGIGNVTGLLVLYRSMRIGQLGVVMPIAATEGGIAALISALDGQSIGALVAVAMAVTVIGVVMTAIARAPKQVDVTPPLPVVPTDPVPHPAGHQDRRAAAWATLVAVLFGVSLFGTGRAGTLLPTGWAVLPPRALGVIAVTIPLALRGRLRWVAGSGRPLVCAGLLEVGGFYAYAAGARSDIAVAAVLSTLTGAFGALLGRLLFSERLRASQVAGVALIFAGVATITAVTS